ncbi:hypothetical protein AAC387_Pa05g0165 [Persea americana]
MNFKARGPRYILAFAIIALFFIGASAIRNIPSPINEPVHVVADNFNNNDKGSYHQGPDLPDEEEVPEWEDFKKLAQKEIEKEEREYMLNYLNK